MRLSVAQGYELDDDPARIDADVVCGYLATEYWSSYRTRDEQERLVRASTRVIGAYAEGGEQVGFCRVVSDGGGFAWLGDVFVLPEHRRRGLGGALVREAVEHPAHRDLPWYLGTRDAHALYEQFGFVVEHEGTMTRPPGRRSATD
jgi:GNAT superfamily N-acetyltransferase